jgi:hypothetical protein
MKRMAGTCRGTPSRTLDKDLATSGTDQRFIRDGDKIFRTYLINSRGDEVTEVSELPRHYGAYCQEEWEDSPEATRRPAIRGGTGTTSTTRPPPSQQWVDKVGRRKPARHLLGTATMPRRRKLQKCQQQLHPCCENVHVFGRGVIAAKWIVLSDPCSNAERPLARLPFSAGNGYRHFFNNCYMSGRLIAHVSCLHAWSRDLPPPVVEKTEKAV